MSEMNINILCAAAFILVSVVIIVRRRITERKAKDNWRIENGWLRFEEPHCSVDVKPIKNIPHGTMVLEEDTKDIYCFDSQEKLWKRIWQ